MYRRLHKADHPDVAASLNNLGGVLQNQGEYARALEQCRLGLQMDQRLYPKDRYPNGHPALAASLNNLALGLQNQGKYSDAEPLVREALHMYRALSESDVTVRSEEGALTLVRTQRLAPDGFLSNARAMHHDPAEVYPEVWTSKAALTRVYERRTLAARATSADPRVPALLDRLKDRRRRRADLILAPTLGSSAAREQRATDLARYAKEIEELDGALRPLLPAVARADQLAKATPADLQKVLPMDAAVVDFLRSNLVEQDPEKPGADGVKRAVHYLAFVVTKDKVSWVDLGPAQPIETAITAWRRAITTRKDIPPELPARVRGLTWARIRKELPPSVKVVYLCPDLALCRVPWAALPGDEPDTVLLEDYAIAVLPHSPFLLDKLSPPDRPAERPNGVLVVGGVDYDAHPLRSAPLPAPRGEPPLTLRRNSRWPPLPATAAEASGVANAAARKKFASRTLEGEKATTSAVLAELPQARCVHLATHGFFADSEFRSAFRLEPEPFQRTLRGERVGTGGLSPMVLSGLVFAGANRSDTPGRSVLTGEALVDLNLSGLELAVLSACETGLGEVADGEGCFGLQRAFHLAGTRDVVASLWKVPDQPTAALMALFYRNLWDKDMSPVEALRQAQLEIYRHPERIPELAAGFRGKLEKAPGSGEETPKAGPGGKAHPRLWAAFTLSGPGR
jgi:CHAT domain-containing protein/tetratricopeptide (TPR) repeat protein